MDHNDYMPPSCFDSKLAIATVIAEVIAAAIAS